MMKVAFHTLGCKVNQYETQAIREDFLKNGFFEVEESEFADCYVINTCTVTHLADRKARQQIRRFLRINPEAVIVATGCYAQMSPDEISKIEGVSLIAGTNEKTKILSHVQKLLEEKEETPVHLHLPYEELKVYEETGRIVSMEDRTRAYIKIEEGCDRFCAYCIIPYARGRVRSRSSDAIVEEAKNLIDKGFKELVLTGINTALYGKEQDFKEKTTLLDLLKTISSLKGDFRIRLSSLEPNVVTKEDVINFLTIPKVCNHLHFSLQSGSDKVLKEMNRNYTFSSYLNIIKSLPENAGITTDIIVGFPGETEEDFKDTLNAVKLIDFVKVHAFPYSKRQGTKAAARQDQIGPGIKKERMEHLEKESSLSRNRFFMKNLNTVKTVLFEEKNEEGLYEGYSENYIRVKVESGKDLKGDFYKVKLKEIEADYMTGELL